MNNGSAIEQTVMRRVRRIRIVRMALSNAVCAAVLCAAALWGIGREVWVAKVFANGPQDSFGHALYLIYAFEHTRLIVQALAIVALASVISLARESARLLAHSFAFAR